MRSRAEIRKHLLLIRDRNQLPYSAISEDSRCSPSEIYAALKFEASENTLRKLDAYLDAPKLHVRRRETKLLWEIEQIDRELYKEYGIRTMHPLRVQKMSEDRQKRYLLAMYFKAKCCLVQMMYVETGLTFKIPDGQTYWQFKAKCLRRAQAVRSRDGNPYYFPRPSPVAEGRKLQPGADENGAPAGVVGGGSDPA